MTNFNPYQAPSAHVDDMDDVADMELAGRGTRLGAIVVDLLIYGVPFLAMLPAIFFARNAAAEGMGVGVIIATAVGGLGILAVIVVNLIMLYRTGQTIGKRLLNVKIVRTDGTRAGLRRIFFLRMLVPGIVGNIPFVGLIFSIVDPLFIFQESRRCVHDLIADTMVVMA